MIPIAVIGAGAMGTGIAHLAATAGHPVRLLDAVPGAAERSIDAIQARARSRHPPAALNLTAAGTLADLAASRVVIEAVVEDLAVKRRLFAELEAVVAKDAILASNTSSFSPDAISAGLASPGRLVGLHFFNPAPVMRLVEVIPGLATDPAVLAAATELAASWGKTVVRAAATPGFLVNRLARPFYAEALRVLEERAADPATVDAVLTGAGGFRMGPFRLMDFIGHDVNEAVTRSVWTGFGYDPRFAPSMAQRALVEAGWLGRKSGRGFYRYDGSVEPPAAACPPSPPPAQVTEPSAGTGFAALLARSGVPIREGRTGDGLVTLPSGALLVRCDGRTATALAGSYRAPVVVVDRALDDGTATVIAIAASDRAPQAAIDEAVGLLQAAGLAVYQVADVPGLVLTRTVAMLVNLAVDALQHGVATAADIDTAMELGTNYPLGPLAWGDRWGPPLILAILENLQSEYGDPRYRASTLLRRIVHSGRSVAAGAGYV